MKKRDFLCYILIMDDLSPENRHKNMSHIRSKDTKPEKQIRSALFKAGFRYRICDKRYPGKPDLIFPRYYAVVFINGCFWHAHENCRYFVFPKSNQEFWKKKFDRNITRTNAGEYALYGNVPYEAKTQDKKLKKSLNR